MKRWLASRLVRRALATHAGAALLSAVAAHWFHETGAASLRGWIAAATAAGLIAYGVWSVTGVTTALRLFAGMVQRLENEDGGGHGEGRKELPVTSLAVDEEAYRLAVALERLGARQRGRLDQLAAERATMEAVLHSLADPVIAVDPSLTIVYANRSALEVFPDGQGASVRHVPGRHVTGQHVSDVIRDHECIALIQQAVHSRTELSTTMQLGPSPARTRTYHVIISPVRAMGDGTAGAVCVFHDQTELLRLERVRSDFVANVSHELRTPLTAVHGFIETLQDGSYLNPERTKRYLGIMHAETTRLIAIINDLLHLSRLEGPASALARERLDMAAIAHEVTELVRKRAEGKGLRLSVDVAETQRLPVVLGDGAAIRQALLNLVDNAVKYTEAGGSVTVKVEPAAGDEGANRDALRRDGAAAVAHQGESDEAREGVREVLRDGTRDGAREGVRVTVIDTGVGIPEEALDRVFERFYRVDKARSRKEGGTGLGLSIVKHTIERHKGRLGIQSQVGKGTSIWFWLPAEEGQGSTQPS